MADQIQASIVVQGMLPDVYQVWATFENFPRFMRNLKSVTVTGDGTSHWVAAGPLGTAVEWDAVTTALEPNRRIAWASVPGSQVNTTGEVRFREVGPNQTEITVAMAYDVPAGGATELVANLMANPEGQVRDALRAFKDYIESTTDRLRDEDDGHTVRPGG